MLFKFNSPPQIISYSSHIFFASSSVTFLSSGFSSTKSNLFPIKTIAYFLSLVLPKESLILSIQSEQLSKLDFSVILYKIKSEDQSGFRVILKKLMNLQKITKLLNQ